MTADYDHGTGYVAAGVADKLEERFGVFPSFGVAGGCVNMVLRLETGHIVNVTESFGPLGHVLDHDTTGLDTGYAVCIYTEEGFANGDDPLVSVVREDALVDELGDVIQIALTDLARKNDFPL